MSKQGSLKKKEKKERKKKKMQNKPQRESKENSIAAIANIVLAATLCEDIRNDFFGGDFGSGHCTDTSHFRSLGETDTQQTLRRPAATACV